MEGDGSFVLFIYAFLYGLIFISNLIIPFSIFIGSIMGTFIVFVHFIHKIVYKCYFAT